MAKKTVSITLEASTWTALHAHAKKDHRTLSAEVDVILADYFITHKIRDRQAAKDKALGDLF